MFILLYSRDGPFHTHIQPVVIYNICDAFIRRNDGQDQVVGALLGTFEEGTFYLKNCLTVTHIEKNEELSMNVIHYNDLLALHRRVYPQEQVLGWFSAGSDVTGFDGIIHRYFIEKCSIPVYLKLNTDFLSAAQSVISTYISREVSLGKQKVATEFIEITNEVIMDEVNTIGFETIASRHMWRVPDEIEGLSIALKHLQTVIDMALQYVEKVCEGEQKGDPRVGRIITGSVSHIFNLLSLSKSKDVLYNTQIDNLLVLHISQLVKAQIGIADTLGTINCPVNFIG